MREMGLPLQIVHLVQRLFEDQLATVRLNSGLTRWFSIGRGVRQGCILSPHLFNLYTESFMRELQDINAGVRVGGQIINELRYADDTVLMANSKGDLIKLITAAKRLSGKYDLLLNVKKTKVMVFDKDCSDKDFQIDDERLDVVDSFDYLGSTITNIQKQASCERDVKKRIAMAKNTFMSKRVLFSDRSIPLELRLRLLKALVFPVLLYGAEGWTLTLDLRRKIEAAEMWFYRRVLKIAWTEKETNANVLRRAGVEKTGLLREVFRRKLMYFGHACRHPGLDNEIVFGLVAGKRGRGRPPMQWADSIYQLFEAYAAATPQLNCDSPVRLAANRKEWRRFVMYGHAVLGG